MIGRLPALALAVLVHLSPAMAAEEPPTADDFKRTLEARLQKLRPAGTTERTVLFQEVRPGTANGGVFPFEATLLIHDYGPGYPPNKFYGETCVGRMDTWRFEMSRDPFTD